MRNGEAKLQHEVVTWLREAMPDAITYAVLNDGLFSKSEAAKRNWMGLAPGLPDVGIAWKGQAFFIELKLPGRTLSDDQQAMMARLRATGVRCGTARSLAEAQALIAAWGMPIRVLVENAA